MKHVCVALCLCRVFDILLMYTLRSGAYPGGGPEISKFPYFNGEKRPKNNNYDEPLPPRNSFLDTPLPQILGDYSHCSCYNGYLFRFCFSYSVHFIFQLLIVFLLGHLLFPYVVILRYYDIYEICFVHILLYQYDVWSICLHCFICYHRYFS